ncbi:SA1362 family protein [Alkalihalobacillus trypoxylicola]|uniref:Uncharacterized protein n=1 Tax=Alkalihalobacillus trypoxylicola TaxID=519424 RepID=A0A161PEI8_9BACI|nr:SA1362 family protein [Alkalihalobacillus trypoxylicola]KYG30969.1 hypothetical protein AZF04_18405 [Alkalihalobacillus trypoxylicola]
MSQAMKYLIPVIIILAIIGLSYQLIFNTWSFIQSILLIVIIAAVIFFLYRLYVSKQYGVPIIPKSQGPTRKQLKKAKRTSTVKPSQPPRRFVSKGTNTVKKGPVPLRKSTTPTKKREHNFTVIEGNKNKHKRKNRA